MTTDDNLNEGFKVRYSIKDQKGVKSYWRKLIIKYY